VTITLSVTAYTKPSAPHNTSDAPVEGITSSLVQGGSVAVNTIACGNCDPGYQTPNPHTGTKQVKLTPSGGSSATINIGLQGGPTFTYTYKASASPPPPAGGETAQVHSVRGEVTVKHADGTTEPLTSTTVLTAGDQVNTGVDSEADLEFADHVKWTVPEMTQILVADLLNKGTRQAVLVQMKLGEVSAQINPKKAFQTDFKVDVPRGYPGSVRGSAMRVFYDPTARIAIFAALQDRAY
jgi:hypothetical protein